MNICSYHCVVSQHVEFVAVMSRKVNAAYTPEQVKSAFKIFEGTAPEGHIKVADLMTALTTYGSKKLTEEQAAELVGQVWELYCITSQDYIKTLTRTNKLYCIGHFTTH